MLSLKRGTPPIGVGDAPREEKTRLFNKLIKVSRAVKISHCHKDFKLDIESTTDGLESLHISRGAKLSIATMKEKTVSESKSSDT